MYVRQHYNLATTGKLGQKATGKSAPKSSSKSMSHTKPAKGSSGYGSKQTPA